MEIFKYVKNLSEKKSLSTKNFEVKYIDLNELDSMADSLPDVLSDDEKQRVKTIKNTQKKRQYHLSRIVLRLLLSTYLHIDPENIVFDYSKSGKPKVLDSFGKELFFNVSHSRNISIFAFSLEHELGIDLEYIDTVKSNDLIIKKFFSTSEQEFLFSLGGDKRTELFFKSWVVKESYLKGIGIGVDGLGKIEVVYRDQIIYLYDRKTGKHLTGWGFKILKPKDNFIACVAFRPVDR